MNKVNSTWLYLYMGNQQHLCCDLCKFVLCMSDENLGGGLQMRLVVLWYTYL